MSKKLFLLFLTVSLLANAFSQTPGYMGKKLTIGYSVLLHPNAFSYFYSADLKYAGPVPTHVLNINIVVAKHRELNLSARYSNRKVNNLYYTHASVANVPNFERFSLMEYSLAIKRYTKTKFAPLGLYAKWEISFLSGWLNYDDYEEIEYDPYTSSDKMVAHKGGKINFMGGGGAYSLGKQRIFSDKYVFDVGFRCSLMFLRSNSEDSHYEEHLVKSAIGPLTATPITSFYAGIGFLAF